MPKSLSFLILTDEKLSSHMNYSSATSSYSHLEYSKVLSPRHTQLPISLLCKLKSLCSVSSFILSVYFLFSLLLLPTPSFSALCNLLIRASSSIFSIRSSHFRNLIFTLPVKLLLFYSLPYITITNESLVLTHVSSLNPFHFFFVTHNS